MILNRFVLSLFLLLGPVSCGAVPKIIILEDPLTHEEHLQLGLLYEAQGEWDLALSEYKAALEKGGPSPVIQGYLGNVYYSKKDYPAARKAYQKSLAVNPKSAPVLNNLAALYVIQGERLAEAETLIRRAVKIDPSRRPYYLDTLASVYMERGEYDVAFSIYLEAEAIAPFNLPLLDTLRKNKKRALSRLEKDDPPAD
ncbi:MAG: tetratricopeptide repeat protein [Nitrospiria bacterium]